MSTFFLVVEFILAVVLTITIMLQKSSSIGLGAYSGSNESMFGAKGPANFLTRFTFIVGVVFVLNTVALTYMFNRDHTRSVVDTTAVVPTVPSAPAAPQAPKAPGH